MDFIKALIGTPAPTLLMIGGLIFLLLGLVTFKKPIVIEVTPANRKVALFFGILLICTGIFLISLQNPEETKDEPPTATATVATTSSTPTPIMSDLSTPILGTISITDTPSINSNQFFVDDCISSNTWLTSSSTQRRVSKNNCLDLSDNGIIASNGDLLINVKSDTPKTSTIYIPIPETGIIKFDIRIEKFDSGENGNLAVGFGEKECKITDGEFIFYRLTDSKIFVVSGFSALEYGETLGKYTLGTTDSLEFHFDKSTFEIYVNDIKSKNGIMPTNESTFCISYRFSEYVDLSSVISNLYIEK